MAFCSNLSIGTVRIPNGVGYSVYTFESGSTTIPASTYADPDGNSANPWPVVLADASDGSGDGVATVYVNQDVTLDIQNTAGASLPGYPLDWVKPATGDEVAALEQQISTELEGNSNDLTLLTSRTTQVESRATALEGRTTTAEGDIDTLESRATALEGRTTTAENDIDTLEGRAGSLEGRTTTAEGDINSLEGRAGSLEGRMNTAEGDIDTLQANLAATTGDLDALSGTVASLESALSATIPEIGGNTYSWNKESDTLTCWGTFSTASDGTATVTFPLSFDASPSVIPVAQWSGSAFVAAKLTGVSTTTASIYAALIDGSGAHPEVVAGHWLAVGKKVG